MWFNAVGCIVTLILSLLTAPHAADAQRLAKVPRMGWLALRSPTVSAQLDRFRDALRELGYLEGQTITLEIRFADQVDQYPDLVAELVHLPVDILVSEDTVALGAVKQATNTIPVVMVGVGDPVASGLVASLARPGGNFTGVTGGILGGNGKRLEILKEAVPGVSRVAVLLQTGHPNTPRTREELQEAARALGVQLHFLEVRDAHDFEGAFAAAIQEHADALFLPPFPLLNVNAQRIVDLAAQSRLPGMYPRRDYMEAGGLMAYAADVRDVYRRAAACVDKILKGAKPADLPVERPMQFELVINLKTAEALGVTIPPAILFQADEVIR